MEDYWILEETESLQLADRLTLIEAVLNGIENEIRSTDINADISSAWHLVRSKADRISYIVESRERTGEIKP